VLCVHVLVLIDTHSMTITYMTKCMASASIASASGNLGQGED